MSKLGWGVKPLGVLFLILLILVFIVWQVTKTSSPPSQSDRSQQIRSDVETLKFTVPNNKQECLTKGGVWKKIGISPHEECNLPTKDAGKVCSGSNECEGVCLATLTQDQLRQGMKGKVFQTTGKCSSFIKVVGCLAYVYKGWASIVCVD